MKGWILAVFSVLIFPLNATAGNSKPPVSHEKTEVHGIITDEFGDPVAGATVSVKEDSSTGAISESNGQYSLTIPVNSTLEVSFVGMRTAEKKTTAGTDTYNFKMTAYSQQVDDVVVVGYGTVKKSDLTAVSYTHLTLPTN